MLISLQGSKSRLSHDVTYSTVYILSGKYIHIYIKIGFEEEDMANGSIIALLHVHVLNFFICILVSMINSEDVQKFRKITVNMVSELLEKLSHETTKQTS